MERYWQEVEQTGRDGLPATGRRRNLVKLAYDISKACKNMTDTTRTNPSNTNKNYRYFDFVNVPINQHPDHPCCDFHTTQEHCQCENCELGNTGGSNIVYMMTFRTEDILKAALATLYGLDN